LGTAVTVCVGEATATANFVGVGAVEVSDADDETDAADEVVDDDADEGGTVGCGDEAVGCPIGGADEADDAGGDETVGVAALPHAIKLASANTINAPNNQRTIGGRIFSS
jgi:hypothetical protein